ncbi:MAG: polysaccharide biosynthesis protein [Chitinophagales bacterium]|nr:polysaccharide biosynthesis protein [Chitinophagales bacterium]
MGVVKRQGIKNTISSYVGILLGFVSLLIIQPKFLKPEEIGLARVLFAFATLISSFISLGVANVTLKYFPYFKNERNGHHGFLGLVFLFPLIGLLLSTICLVVFKEFIIAQYRIQSPLFIDYYSLILPFSVFLSCNTVISTYLIAQFKSTVPSYLSDVYVRVAYIILIVCYHFKFMSLPLFITVYVGIYAIQLLAMILYMYRVDNPVLVPDWQYAKSKNLKEMLLFGFMLSFTAIAVLGLKTLDSVLLGKFLPLSVVGVYAIVSFIPTVIEAPYNALDRVVTAKVSHALAENNIEDLRKTYYQSVKYLTLIGGLLFVLVNTNIDDLLSIIGKDYANAGKIVWIISIGSLMNMMGGANNSIIMYASRYWVAASISVVLVVITFGLNMLLIPRWGVDGAAFSTAISWGGYSAIRVYMVWKKFGFQPYNIGILKNLVLVVFCVLASFILPQVNNHLLSIFLKTALCATFYAIGIFYTQTAPELFERLKQLRP